MRKKINELLCWARVFVQNCIQTEEGAKQFAKILKREVVPNKDSLKVDLRKGDVIILYEKPILYWLKVTDI